MTGTTDRPMLGLWARFLQAHLGCQAVDSHQGTDTPGGSICEGSRLGLQYDAPCVGRHPTTDRPQSQPDFAPSRFAAGEDLLLTRRRVLCNSGRLGIWGGLLLMNGPEVSLATSLPAGGRIALPEPEVGAGMPVETALRSRRSIRDFNGNPLSLAQVSQMVWAAQGTTSPEGYRSAPSAGALYPLDVYLLTQNVVGLTAGVYLYHPQQHELDKIVAGDRRRELSDAALAQGWIRMAAAVIVLAAVFRRTTRKYGERGHRYVHLEAGHAAQNVYLQATSLGLGTTTVGAFHDERVKAVLELPAEAQPLCLLPIGFPV